MQEEFVIPESYQGQRLDKALASLLPQYSRVNIQSWLKAGNLLIDQNIANAKTAVKGGEKVSFIMPEKEDTTSWESEDLNLDIIYEDEDLLIINKPIGLVVHPAAGNWEGTLVNGLLHYCPALRQIPRAGIVHRLDKDTSGLLVVAKTLIAQNHLVKSLQNHHVQRTYSALVYGQVIAGDTIDAPLGRDPRNRQKIAIHDLGKPAITHYRVQERFDHFTLLKVQLETGRTHQIRVHMASVRHPIVGDQTYGPGLKLPPRASAELIAALKNFRHQALHATELSFDHPVSGKKMRFKSPLPEDFENLLAILREKDFVEEDEWEEMK